MIKSFSFFVLLLVLSLGARATEPTDLGKGLAYLRVPSLSTPLAKLRPTALVLDLRYVTTDQQSPATLQALLAQQPSGTPWFILVSPATPAVLAPIITASSALTLGTTDSIPAPKVIVRTDPTADRRAYDAFTSGTPLAQLISGKIEKERYDEATLVKEFNEGIPEPQPPPAVDPTAPKPTSPADKTAPAPAAPLTDRVLQRAVHLHAAMLVLKPRS